MSKVKVLVFAADPLSAVPDGPSRRLLLDKDIRRMKEKVRAAEFRDDLEFDVRWATRTEDLLQALNETHPEVVHFSGHGTSDGLVLVGKDERPHTVDAATLAELFEVFRGDIQVVVLNACFSFPQAQAIAASVGCAIGTHDEISDDAAITFGASFYSAIAFGHSVQTAFQQARLALRLDHHGDSEFPDIVVRDGVDPAQLVLVRPKEDEEREAAERAGRDRRERIETERVEAVRGTAHQAGSEPAHLPASDAPPGWIFPAIVWMLAGAGALALVENVVEALLLSLAPLLLAIELQSLARSGRFEVLTHTAARILALLFSAGVLVVGANLLNGDLVAATRYYQAGNYAAALPLFQKLAEREHPEAMGFLGIMYLAEQGTQDRDSAGLGWLVRAAVERDARAMYALGIACETGEGAPPDPAKAREWYQQAADKGHAEAMNKMGEMFRQGIGGDQNLERALHWYGRAARAGSLDGMANFAWMNELGLAGARDTGEAFRWFRKAARAGSHRAMVDLGWLYANAIGVRRNDEEAVKWYRGAAEAGNADGMNNLGVLYVTGRGEPADTAQAIRWFQQAARAGSIVAAENLAKLGRGDGAGRGGAVAFAVSRSGR